MAGGRVKKKDGENLAPANIEKVIALLEQGKPITKKEACEILNISYNTARLTKIIEQYKEDKARTEKFKAANRGKPATPTEIQTCIEGYLDGDSLATIAESLFRSTSFVKGIIERIGVPSRNAGDYFHPEFIPEQCQAESFEPGQVVWSARYNSLAIVLKEAPSTRGYKVYKVWIVEPLEEESPYFPQIQGYGGRHAAQAVFDLGSLEHLKEYGIDVYRPLRPHFKQWLAGR